MFYISEMALTETSGQESDTYDAHNLHFFHSVTIYH
jgi:hypothetical protein